MSSRTCSSGPRAARLLPTSALVPASGCRAKTSALTVAAWSAGRRTAASPRSILDEGDHPLRIPAGPRIRVTGLDVNDLRRHYVPVGQGQPDLDGEAVPD